MQGLPETDPQGALLRSYLCNAGGESALMELDLKKATVSAVARAFGADLTRDPVIITERNGVLVVRVVVQEPQGDREQEQEEEIESETEDTRPEPTTFTEDADVVERDCAPPAA